MVDFGWGGSVADDESWDDYELWESDVLSLAIVSNAGYRFRFSNRFILGVGAFAGAGFELKDEVTHTGETPRRKEMAENDVWPFLMLEGSLGFEF